MKRSNFSKITLVLFAALFSIALISDYALAQGRWGGGNGVCIDSLPKEDLSDYEIASLLHMREEEKLAHDVYVTLFEQWNAPVFERIAASEAQHASAVLHLLEKYELEDPAKEELGEFSDETLKALYDQLVAAGQASLIEAYKVGATIEDLDIYDLLDALEQVDNVDIKWIYQNLLKGSRNHMRSFYSLLLLNDVTYVAQYISAEQLEAIISTPRERGPVDADGNPLGRGGRGRNGGKRGPGYGYGPGDGSCDPLNPGQQRGPKIRLMLGNYPNPANPSTQIVYALPEAAAVKLSIFNIRGQLVREFDMGYQNAGSYQKVWDARDQSGMVVPSGTYIYRLQAGNEMATQRFLLLK